jgi:transposase
MDPPTTATTRFIALDVHRPSVTVAAVDAQQTVVLRPRRMAMDGVTRWSREHLGPTDAVVVEATANAWHLDDHLAPLVASVTVGHPLMVTRITAARVKTDPREALHRARNRLQRVLHRHHLCPPEGKPFAASRRSWWAGLELAPSERLRVRQDLTLLDHLDALVREVDADLARLSTVAPWAQQVAFLVHLPGVGLPVAMTVLAAMGDITRFPAAAKVVGYAGLGARVDASGLTHRTGGITKQGRRELRAVLVEAAWVAVQTHPYGTGVFARRARRLGRNQAIVAIARTLLVVSWHVLTARVADQQADPAKVALTMMTWAWPVGSEQRGGLSPGQVVRRELTRLQLGEELIVVRHSGRNLRIPHAEDEGGGPRQQSA